MDCLQQRAAEEGRSAAAIAVVPGGAWHLLAEAGVGSRGRAGGGTGATHLTSLEAQLVLQDAGEQLPVLQAGEPLMALNELMTAAALPS